MKLSIGFITSRFHCELKWFLDSLEPQIHPGDEVEVIVVDHFAKGDTQFRNYQDLIDVRFVEPKPNPWSGRHRLTKDHWWSKANSINTFLALAKHEFVMMVDDRCVLEPGSLNAVREAIKGGYILCGSYQKRHSMTVEDGLIKHGGIITAEDGRTKSNHPVTCGGEWFFGCITAAPLQWWLDINGAPEKCDSLSFEDCITGFLFQNSGRTIKYDPRAMIIEDRTVDKLGEAMKRTSKEKHPYDTADKAHTLLRWVKAGAKRSENDWDINDLRGMIARGEPFPTAHISEEKQDWFDGMLIKDMQ